MLLQELQIASNETLAWYSEISGMAWLRAFLVLIVGWAISKIIATRLVNLLTDYVGRQANMLLRRGVFYLGMLATLTLSLHQLNFSLTVLLGAAGVLTVGIGFASQTSASNIISGIFLLGERPFSVGDVIQVGGTTGEVLSIDLLAIHLRTFDNIFVRIPNETVIKSEVRTLSRFPIRRYDLQLGIAYKEDLERVRKVLLDVADKAPLCLEEPAPLINFQNFGDSSVNLQFSVWTARENYLNLRNQISSSIKERFDAEGIKFPFPHRTLYAGSTAAPAPFRMPVEE